MKIILKILLAAVLIALIGSIYLYNTINDYQRDGSLSLTVLDAPVTVRRDQLSIPYIEAESLADALRAQGFIIGQDRLYQVQLFRLLALGRLSEIFGDRGINNDTLIRLIDLGAIAKRFQSKLDQASKDYYTWYIEGLNEYILNYQHEHALATKALKMPLEAWTLEDIITLQLFQSWSNASIWRGELMTQQLIDEVGLAKTQQISQVSINPNDGSVAEADLLSNNSPSINTPADDGLSNPEATILQIEAELLDAIPDSIDAGSNAWATGSRKSKNGKPIFSNNPHLPATTLPGFWLPMGIFTPELKAVGVTAPGSPGIGVGRTDYIAYGATVGGGDGVDLYIEQLDPDNEDHYLQGNESLALTIRMETLRVKDKTQADGFRNQEIRIRSTSRGPLISDHGITVSADKAISLRWAAIDSAGASLGSDRLLLAKSVAEAAAAIEHFTASLSHVVVDKAGGIARISGGRIPNRTSGDGASPSYVNKLSGNGFENWNGLIPQSQMPKEINPSTDWVGTANHRIVTSDYPYEYSKDFATSWRYRRIKQVMQDKQTMTAEDHWQLINDVYNPMADVLVPVFARALQQSAEHADLADILLKWNRYDDANLVAPTLFQLLHRHLASLTFSDELSAETAERLLDSIRFWQERLILMLEDANHPWFDVQGTQKVESRDDILQMAVNATVEELHAELGKDPKQWQWGKLHTITFNSPVIPGKYAAKYFGGGTHPMFGSSETLNRGKFKFSQAYDTTIIDSVRLVADMSDDEKVLVVIPGGASGRYFDESLTNQVDDWLAGRPNYIWFDPNKVLENTVHELRLEP